MDADLDALATALYVRVDDAVKDDPSMAPWRPKVGIAPKLSDAELVTVAVMQAFVGLHLRDPLAALRPPTPAASVPVSARPSGLQQTTPWGRGADRHADPDAGGRHLGVDR